MRLSKHVEITGRSVIVLDDVVDRQQYNVFCRDSERLPYRHVEVASSSSGDIKHWVHEFDPLSFRLSTVADPIAKGLAEGFEGETFKLSRTYINGAKYGDWLLAHRDCAPTKLDVTAVLFLCEEWDINWGGELVLYDEQGDIGAAIAMRPNRLVLFRGSLQHAGRAPNRGANRMRLTLALKYERVVTGSP